MKICFISKCMNEFGIDHATMKAANDCVNSSEGMELLKTLGDETNSLEPKLSFVPWLTFNGVRSIKRP